MKIHLARTAGFCMGVRRAVDMVLDLRREAPPGPIVTYGPLIHNPQTLQVLRSKGILEVQSIDEIQQGTVVIRAHGISPLERQTLQNRGLKVIDATCPRVSRVQAIIRRHAAKKHFCVIVGDEDHPEVRGLIGFASSGGLSVHSADEQALLESIPNDREVCVVAQTTQEAHVFDCVVDRLKERGCQLHVHNTICDSTRKRQAEVSQLARRADMIVVVGGKGSGNTRRLVQVAEAQGARTLHVETEEEIPESALETARIVGVTAGASTPNWQIRRVIDKIKEIGRKRKTGLCKKLGRAAEVAVMTYVSAALGGAGLTAACLTMQGRKVGWLPLAVTMLFVFSMHILNRVQERSGAVRFNTPEIAAFYAQYRAWLTALGAVSAGAALAMSYQMGGYACAVLAGMIALALLVTGLLYFAPILFEKRFGRLRWRSLSDLPGAKTPLVAMGWAVAAAVLPVIGRDRPVEFPPLAVAFLFSAGMVFWRSALSDLLDIQGDRIMGRSTIPIMTGVKRTGSLLVAMLVLIAWLLVGSVLGGIVPSVGLLLLTNVGLFGFFYALYRRHHLLDRFLIEGAMDGNLLLAGAISMVYAMS
jgi:(E)-4-hydroxy-3-methyl-but-2-enyl pyrophosphate reductase